MEGFCLCFVRLSHTQPKQPLAASCLTVRTEIVPLLGPSGAQTTEKVPEDR